VCRRVLQQDEDEEEEEEEEEGGEREERDVDFSSGSVGGTVKAIRRIRADRNADGAAAAGFVLEINGSGSLSTEEACRGRYGALRAR